MTPPLLELRHVCKAFGKVVIADGINLTLNENEGLGIIGPNGAGKSTLFNLITGDLSPNGGDILISGKSVLSQRPHQRCRSGVGRSYQIPHPFGKMSVFENVLTAATFGGAAAMGEAEAMSLEILGVTGLLNDVNTPAGKLTLLKRKRLELARALSTRPRLLLLDEIAGGLTEAEVQALISTIRDIRRSGVSLIWIEHIVHALLATVDRLVVLNGGMFLADGDPHEVMRAPDVQRIYMGVEPA
ncbi:ATP-binding cassette domain-containing protein [Roseobacter sp. YSTF-M11]|uniref:ATP-binding cassette domain-containing protein n=1 Tax=Roseobacter insulae TaxID=2859783 RepID=A0A9X1FRA5_9RHOB|nr:ATP-binding cassette domain-containing protein [Roseobacter insulae]MBW4706329.1 ATP-binding cassette domain-containing protein [Roseobacter insulae]